MKESNTGFGPDFQVQCDLVRELITVIRDALGPGLTTVTATPVDRDTPRFSCQRDTAH